MKIWTMEMVIGFSELDIPKIIYLILVFQFLSCCLIFSAISCSLWDLEGEERFSLWDLGGEEGSIAKPAVIDFIADSFAIEFEKCSSKKNWSRTNSSKTNFSKKRVISDEVLDVAVMVVVLVIAVVVVGAVVVLFLPVDVVVDGGGNDVVSKIVEVVPKLQNKFEHKFLCNFCHTLLVVEFEHILFDLRLLMTL